MKVESCTKMEFVLVVGVCRCIHYHVLATHLSLKN